MTHEEFTEFTEEVIPQALFHVTYTDIDDETGGRLEEVILAGLIGHNSGCLKYKPLQWFLDTYLSKPLDTYFSKPEDMFHIDPEIPNDDDWFEIIEREEFRQAENEYYKNHPSTEELPEDLFTPSTEEELWVKMQNDERVII